MSESDNLFPESPVAESESEEDWREEGDMDIYDHVTHLDEEMARNVDSNMKRFEEQESRIDKLEVLVASILSSLQDLGDTACKCGQVW